MYTIRNICTLYDTRGNMLYNNAVYEIIKTPLAFKLLRYMILYETEQTGRETARNIGISFVHAHRILEGLVKQGIVIKRKAGKANLFKINQKHETVKRILQPLVLEEKGLAKNILTAKLELAAKKALSVVLYGSVSEGKEGPDSDVDVFFLVKDSQTKEILKEKLSELAEDFAISTGNRLDSLILTVAEYLKEKNNKKGVVESIEKGELLFGKPIGEVIQK